MGLAGGDYTFGYRFSVSTTTIGSLGIFDYGKNGLSQSHEVGLWNSSGTLLDSVTVPAGTAGTLVESQNTVDGWRFSTLSSPVELAAGDYVLGAFYQESSPDRYVDLLNQPSEIVTAPGFSYGQTRNKIPSSGLEFPDYAESPPYYYLGPNLMPVPEPTTVAALVALGVMGGFGLWRLRRRKSQCLVTQGNDDDGERYCQD